MEKLNENLETMLKDFEGRITLENILQKNLQEYPNPIQEKQCLMDHMELLRDTQATLEDPPKRIERPKPLIPNLETLNEDQYLKLEYGDLRESKQEKGM